MSFRLWWNSLLSPDVTVEGRRARGANPDPFGLRATADWQLRFLGEQIDAQVKAQVREAERLHRLQRDEYQRHKAAMRAQLQEVAATRAAALSATDRPPVRQGRDL